MIPVEPVTPEEIAETLAYYLEQESGSPVGTWGSEVTLTVGEQTFVIKVEEL
jgi:hypothetical protein